MDFIMTGNSAMDFQKLSKKGQTRGKKKKEIQRGLKKQFRTLKKE
jgi:hypothetical protein